MTPNKTIIKDFFQGEKQYAIPVYQRAYSWEKKQWKDFLADLEEATKGNNQYFFGNVLLELNTADKTNDIIDGQQRVTTIIIFARALCNVLQSRAKNETLSSERNNEDFLKYIEEDYLINRSKAKLQAVEYDRDYFKDVIINNDDKKHEPQTLSQKRIKEAKTFFEDELKKKGTKEILAIFQALQNAEILSIPFTNKKDSVLMFELQNNRGKELTNMEKLKSYLAYQIYTYCDKEASEMKLREITSIFEAIYRLINDIKTDEDSILRYFNISYSKFGFNYRENDNDLNYKKQYREDTANKSNEEKITWIEKYIKELKNAFVNFKEFENSQSIYGEYLIYLKVWEVYPFILKAYTMFKDKEQLKQVFQALEIIAFRDKLVCTRADLASRLNDVLKNFDSIEKLVLGLQEICSDNKWYWRNEAVKESLLNIYEESNSNTIAYLLMRYENYLREKHSATKCYSFELKEIKEPQIEHIAPQTENGEKLASGYCKYDKTFYDKYCLHCIGNLLLIGASHNVAIGNKPFKDKLTSYENSPLIQQKEIKDFAINEKWEIESIGERHEKLENFVLETWSF